MALEENMNETFREEGIQIGRKLSPEEEYRINYDRAIEEIYDDAIRKMLQLGMAVNTISKRMNVSTFRVQAVEYFLRVSGELAY